MGDGRRGMLMADAIRLLILLAEWPWPEITTAQIRKELEWKRRTASRWLRVIEGFGLVEQKGFFNSGRWTIRRKMKRVA